MLFMKLPYYGGNLYEVVSDIRARPLEIPEGTEPEIAELLRGMLSIDPAARFGMDQLAENPLFAKKDRYEVPETPPPALKKGPVVAYSAQVCGEEFSFASIQVCTVRRFSVGPMAPPTRSLGPKARTVGVIRRVLPEGRRVWRS
jgi:serine/threonine protein kinase